MKRSSTLTAAAALLAFGALTQASVAAEFSAPLGAPEVPSLPAPAVPALPSAASVPELAVPALQTPAASTLQTGGLVIAPAAATAQTPRSAVIQSAVAPAVKALASLPSLGQASASDARSSGASLSDAITGERSLAGSGEAIVPPAAAAAATPLAQQVQAAKTVVDKVRSEVSKVIVGQKDMVDGILMALIAKQHVLLEGLPGVAKTQTAKAFANAIDGEYQRVSGKADAQPSDIVGMKILQIDPETGRRYLELKKGPVFTNILLVDEINRMPPKAQSGVLEPMAEGQVTIDGETHKLPRLTVLATQNPVEQDGTYPLPEAQVDRFFLKINVPQPSEEELIEIADRYENPDKQPTVNKVTTLAELDEVRKVAFALPMSVELRRYIARVAMAATANPDLSQEVAYHVYTRANMDLRRAARIHALMAGRDFVSDADVRAVAPAVLRHRIVVRYQSTNGSDALTPDRLIAKILDTVKLK